MLGWLLMTGLGPPATAPGRPRGWMGRADCGFEPLVTDLGPSATTQTTVKRHGVGQWGIGSSCEPRRRLLGGVDARGRPVLRSPLRPRGAGPQRLAIARGLGDGSRGPSRHGESASRSSMCLRRRPEALCSDLSSWEGVPPHTRRKPPAPDAEGWAGGGSRAGVWGKDQAMGMGKAGVQRRSETGQLCSARKA